ncbi:hypothetical protein GCM10008933_17890 [Paenibacillus motobuensis]|uniref:Uncharacterized protein n=1 Tax=Paenibacillus motobuensis TaxID=295324 RepID=A0ABN0Y9B4_9BACL
MEKYDIEDSIIENSDILRSYILKVIQIEITVLNEKINDLAK